MMQFDGKMQGFFAAIRMTVSPEISAAPVETGTARPGR